MSIQEKPFSKLAKSTYIDKSAIIAIVQDGTDYKILVNQLSSFVSNNRNLITATKIITLEDLLINEFTISPSDDSAINIKCLAFTKAEFIGKFGQDTISRIVKFSLETTIIKAIPKLTTASSIATHSLVNSFSSTATNGVKIFCDESSSPTTRHFAGCFADEYMEWAEDRGETATITGEFLNTVQLVFAGEYFEVEWRDWDNDGMFRPWVRPPLWYKQPHINSGGILKKNNYINSRCKGIATSTFSQNYALTTSALTIAGIDLGDILSENHCLKYRLGMLIPKQIAPNCLASGGKRSDFRQDSLLLEAPSSLSAVAKISTTMYASELCPLMYDNASNSYMPIHMSNRTIKGYSEIKTMYSNDLRQMAEHNAVLRHEHGATSTFSGGAETLGIMTEQTTNASDDGASRHFCTTFYYKPIGTVATTIGAPTKSRVTTENRVDSIYQQMYLFF